MYESFFELCERPFPSTPDQRAYFPAASHQESLALLRCGMEEGEGIAVVLGAAGVGKTLLCHQLIDAVDPENTLVFINNINSPSIESLLQSILHDLSLPFEGAGEQRLRLQLVDYLMERFSESRRTIFFIDEAQNLSFEQLEELRLLTNLEGRSEKAVQIVLFAQERFRESMTQERLESLRQRIAISTQLRPFSDEETIEYIRAEIARVGGSADSIFTASALSEICEYSAGIPRRINQLCHRTLMLAYADDCGTLDGDYVHMAASQLFLVKADSVESHHFGSLAGPRRIFSDLAFSNLDARSSRRAELPIDSEHEETSVVELGSDVADPSQEDSSDPFHEPASIEVGQVWEIEATNRPSRDSDLPRSRRHG